jgi:hypothetical protein
MEAEQGVLKLSLGDVKVVDAGVPLFLAASSRKACSSTDGSTLVNVVLGRMRSLVFTEHVTARLASCYEHAKSMGLCRVEQSRRKSLIL